MVFNSILVGVLSIFLFSAFSHGAICTVTHEADAKLLRDKIGGMSLVGESFSFRCNDQPSKCVLNTSVPSATNVTCRFLACQDNPWGDIKRMGEGSGSGLSAALKSACAAAYSKFGHPYAGNDWARLRECFESETGDLVQVTDAELRRLPSYCFDTNLFGKPNGKNPSCGN